MKLSIDLEQMQLNAEAELFKLQLEDSIDSWYAASPLRSGYPHASAILKPETDFCLRQLILQKVLHDEAKRPEPRPWDNKRNAIFLHGWSLHEKYQKLFTSFWSVVEVERAHFDQDALLWFTPDAVVNFLGRNVLVEIKGYNAEACSKLSESGKPPKDAHVQANLYMCLLGLKKAYILVENKDNQTFMVWCIKYSPELAQPFLERVEAFKQALDIAESGEQFPSRCCASISDKQAQQCPMRNTCFMLPR